MSPVQVVTVADDDNGSRLDKWFKRHFPAVSHGRLQKLLRTGQVRLDGRRTKANERLAIGQQVRVPPLRGHETAPAPKAKSHIHVAMRQLAQELRGRVLYQDDEILAIDKPSGLAVQGGSKTNLHIDGALDGLKLGAKDRPRLVHRLDRNTSGVLLLGRSRRAAQWLTTAFQRRETRKLYWAIVAGAPPIDAGIIDLALDKNGGRQGEKIVASEDGRSARTLFRVVDRASRRAAWLAMEPLTGRTHQLRAHAALALKTPIIGDGKYGGSAAFPDGFPEIKTMQLHARAIQLEGLSGRPILIECPLPGGMRENFKFLGFQEQEELTGFLNKDDLNLTWLRA